MEELRVYAYEADEPDHGFVSIDGVNYTPDDARDLAKAILLASAYAEAVGGEG